jgi:hypothetical protein
MSRMLQRQSGLLLPAIGAAAVILLILLFARQRTSG